MWQQIHRKEKTKRVFLIAQYLFKCPSNNSNAFSKKQSKWKNQFAVQWKNQSLCMLEKDEMKRRKMNHSITKQTMCKKNPAEVCRHI